MRKIRTNINERTSASKVSDIVAKITGVLGVNQTLIVYSDQGRYHGWVIDCLDKMGKVSADYRGMDNDIVHRIMIIEPNGDLFTIDRHGHYPDMEDRKNTVRHSKPYFNQYIFQKSIMAIVEQRKKRAYCRNTDFIILNVPLYDADFDQYHFFSTMRETIHKIYEINHVVYGKGSRFNGRTFLVTLLHEIEYFRGLTVSKEGLVHMDGKIEAKYYDDVVERVEKGEDYSQFLMHPSTDNMSFRKRRMLNLSKVKKNGDVSSFASV